ncbi:hypothetical protein [Gloeobacter violaceus]|uniref:Gll1551 protein n=1 Tax=Gloeobacter violaceus (strain ATCC 29082 / PCC 7421) TaxID=251221 RepID=Q7NKC7_GLOVI|nr:hypothetical protein [Gloeobacter violaceus]BAC89492.1 gll1551 [Gloeobacter violaceus PCC 7421]
MHTALCNLLQEWVVKAVRVNRWMWMPAAGVLFLCGTGLGYANPERQGQILGTEAAPVLPFKTPSQPVGEVEVRLIGAEVPVSAAEPLQTAEPVGGGPLPLVAAALPFGESAVPADSAAMFAPAEPFGEESSIALKAVTSSEPDGVRRPSVGTAPWMKLAPLPLRPSALAVAVPTTASPPMAPGPAAALAQIAIPLKDGTVATADRLLAVQERVWHWKGGAIRRQIAGLINLLIDTRDLEVACERSGLSLNEVQYLLKSFEQ